ncbi:hypothetical protein PI124_g4729 [Phytophthora idaei]|nr:hypothetical protein PI124_g4729 [Phytophthora idaei]
MWRIDWPLLFLRSLSDRISKTLTFEQKCNSIATSSLTTSTAGGTGFLKCHVGGQENFDALASTSPCIAFRFNHEGRSSSRWDSLTFAFTFECKKKYQRALTRRFRSVGGSSPVAKFANDFVNALKGRRDRKTFGLCCSITWQTAQQFAKTHGFAHAYGPYEELRADRDVDVVYIATINLVHFDQITLALNHGKHVLEEKPMAMNVAQATAAISLAREKNLFLMEGMWTRFFLPSATCANCWQTRKSKTHTTFTRPLASNSTLTMPECGTMNSEAEAS